MQKRHILATRPARPAVVWRHFAFNSLTVVEGDDNTVNLEDDASGDVHGDDNEINHDEDTPGTTDGFADGSGNTVNDADSVQQTGPNTLHSQRTNA